MSMHLISVQLAGIQSLLPNHPMARLFGLKVMINDQSPSDEDLRAIDELVKWFPDSLYLLTQKAIIHYHQKGAYSSSFYIRIS